MPSIADSSTSLLSAFPNWSAMALAGGKDAHRDCRQDLKQQPWLIGLAAGLRLSFRIDYRQGVTLESLQLRFRVDQFGLG
jgi:hypothetical protein